MDLLHASGLYDELVAARLLTPHRRLDGAQALLPAGWQLLKPGRLPVISDACEWTDAQLRSAALLTLELQRRALAHGMTLKDASSFNVQCAGACPVFIDILSFTGTSGDRARVAYRQFCERFLGPGSLRRHVSGIETLASTGVGGCLLATASRLPPVSTRLRPGLTLHMRLHARTAAAAAKQAGASRHPTGAATR